MWWMVSIALMLPSLFIDNPWWIPGYIAGCLIIAVKAWKLGGR